MRAISAWAYKGANKQLDPRCLPDPRDILSMRRPATEDITSDSVELCEAEVCFLHIQLVGTNVRLPKMHNVPPEVDFESSRSPAKSESSNSPSLHCLAQVDLESSRSPAKAESWNNPNRQCCAGFLTCQYCM